MQIKLALVNAVLLCLLFFASTVWTKEEYSRQEKLALDKIRLTVNNILTKDYQREDEYLIRWARSHDLDVNNAVAALRHTLKWRKDNMIDSILNENILSFAKLPYTMDGVDKTGRPVLAWTAASVDLRNLILNGRRDKFLRYLLQSTEKADVLARERYRNGTSPDTKYFSVLDVTGFSRSQHGCLDCIELLVDWIRQTEKNYPGAYFRDIWINTPRIAIPIINILTPFMGPDSKTAFKAFGASRDEWKKYLLKYIPADQLTFQFGGTKST